MSDMDDLDSGHLENESFGPAAAEEEEEEEEEEEVSHHGPLQPSAEVKAEMMALLEADESRLGQVYRCNRDGIPADAITGPNVWRYNRIAKALLEGNLPAAPTVARRSARKFRSILKSAELSEQARSYLRTNLDELERRASDETQLAEETEIAREQTKEAESRDEPGVYVYALPHYLRYPFEPATGRTLLKVGHSGSDAIKRFRAQIRTTALPEEPILLRVYRTSGVSSAAAESDFHRLLEAADHSRSVARAAGREWFVTSTRFLDEVARVMKLAIVVVTDVGDLDDD
jgi:T5orf172 domain